MKARVTSIREFRPQAEGVTCQARGLALSVGMTCLACCLYFMGVVVVQFMPDSHHISFVPCGPDALEAAMIWSIVDLVYLIISSFTLPRLREQ